MGYSLFLNFTSKQIMEPRWQDPPVDTVDTAINSERSDV